MTNRLNLYDKKNSLRKHVVCTKRLHGFVLAILSYSGHGVSILTIDILYSLKIFIAWSLTQLLILFLSYGSELLIWLKFFFQVMIDVQNLTSILTELIWIKIEC
jgi:hypothetical protein